MPGFLWCRRGSDANLYRRPCAFGRAVLNKVLDRKVLWARAVPQHGAEVHAPDLLKFGELLDPVAGRILALVLQAVSERPADPLLIPLRDATVGGNQRLERGLRNPRSGHHGPRFERRRQKPHHRHLSFSRVPGAKAGGASAIACERRVSAPRRPQGTRPSQASTRACPELGSARDGLTEGSRHPRRRKLGMRLPRCTRPWRRHPWQPYPASLRPPSTLGRC